MSDVRKEGPVKTNGYKYIGFFRLRPPIRYAPHPSYRARIIHYVKIRHVRLGDAYNVHPLSWWAQTERSNILIIYFLYPGIKNIKRMYKIEKQLKTDLTDIGDEFFPSVSVDCSLKLDSRFHNLFKVHPSRGIDWPPEKVRKGEGNCLKKPSNMITFRVQFKKKKVHG